MSHMQTLYPLHIFGTPYHVLKIFHAHVNLNKTMCKAEDLFHGEGQIERLKVTFTDVVYDVQIENYTCTVARLPYSGGQRSHFTDHISCLCSISHEHTGKEAIENALDNRRTRKVASHSVFDCYLSPVGRKMKIENSCFLLFWSTFVDSITVFDWRLSDVIQKIFQTHVHVSTLIIRQANKSFELPSFKKGVRGQKSHKESV